MEEFLIFLLAFLFLFVLPFLFYSFLNSILRVLFFKDEGPSYLGLIRKTWLLTLVWGILMWVGFIIFFNLPDSLLYRSLTLVGFVGAVIGINYLVLRKITAKTEENKKRFNAFYIISNLISLVILSSFFYGSFPNKIIYAKSESDFVKKLQHVSVCSPVLKELNDKLFNKTGIIYAQFNQTTDDIYIVKRINETDRKELFNRFNMTRITAAYLDTAYMRILDDQIKDTAYQFNLKKIQPENVEQHIIHAYSSAIGDFTGYFNPDYHFSNEGKMNCESYSTERSVFANLFYDEKSRILVVKESIPYSGP
jgi:hypothetical protein